MMTEPKMFTVIATEEELRVLLYALDNVPKAPMGKRAREVRQELYFRLAGMFLTRERKDAEEGEKDKP